MPPPDSHPRPPRPPVPRIRWVLPTILTLAVLGLALADGRAARQLDRQRQQVLDWLEDPALASLPAEVEERLGREADPAWRSMLLARALVATELDLERTPAMDPSAKARARRLSIARQAAADTLTRRPSSWQGALFLGSATYLERSVTEDRRLFTAYREWEAPLELARDLAPGRQEAGRFLAVAYLELWPAVAEAKRRVARELVTEAFRDPRLFARLVEPWLAVAEDRDSAFARIPDEPVAWRQVQQALERQGDWPGVLEARRRLRAAEAAERRRLVERATLLQERRDGDTARRLLLTAATLGDPQVAAVPALLQALDRLPPGPAGTLEPRFRAWLDWALELCHRQRCPLPAEILDRIAGLAGPLEPPVAAHAALVSGRLADGERWERRSQRSWRAEWAPYHVERARQLRARGETAAALEALGRIPSGARDAAYWLLHHDLEAAVDQPLDHRRRSLDQATRALADYRGPVWGAGGWSLAGDGQTRDLWLTPDLAGRRGSLVITPVVVPQAGAVVEVRLDGRLVLQEVLTPGRELRLPAPAPGLHQLRVESVAGGRVLAGEVRLVAERPRGGAQAAPRSTTAANALAG